MGKFLYTFLFLSIFCTSKYGNYTIQICNYPEGNITKAQLLKLTESSCEMIKFYDADGNELHLKEYVIAAVPSNKKNKFWSLETNGKLNPNQKQMLAKLEAGDEFLVQNVVILNGDNAIKLEAPFRFKVVK